MSHPFLSERVVTQPEDLIVTRAKGRPKRASVGKKSAKTPSNVAKKATRSNSTTTSSVLSKRAKR